MSDFRPMNECKGFNMERVLLKNKNGYMITAYFKDGMLQCDGDEDWTHPIAWDSFIRLRDLANGANASENTLPIDSVIARLSKLQRYDVGAWPDGCPSSDADDDGDWICFDDVDEIVTALKTNGL
jgi:hypothetical protein